MPDWIPSGDLPSMQFLVAQAAYVAANTSALGVPTARATLFTDAVNDFSAAMVEHDLKQDQARAATVAKDQAKALAEQLAREVAGIVQGNPNVTDQQRLAGGWPVRDTTRTPVPPPSEAPVLTVDTGRRLQHVIRFGFGEGRGRAKPAGVSGYGVWVKIGGETPPTDVTACTFVALSSKGTLTTTFPGTDGGKTAWYIAACLNAKGERGPLSETVAATIAA